MSAPSDANARACCQRRTRAFNVPRRVDHVLACWLRFDPCVDIALKLAFFGFDWASPFAPRHTADVQGR